MAKITYDNKVNVRTLPNPENEKGTAGTFNEIKAAVNALYDIPGWGYYQDSGATPINVTTAPVLLGINKSVVVENYLPQPIRGTGTLFAGNKITPIRLGDSYDSRLDLTVESKSGNPNYIIMQLDIGGQTTPTNVMAERDIVIQKTPPFKTNVSLPFFTLADFMANGGQIFIKTDVGSCTVSNRAIFIKRDFSDV